MYQIDGYASNYDKILCMAVHIIASNNTNQIYYII